MTLDPQRGFDVVVLGEPLVEFAAGDPLRTACRFERSFSGDALNAAAAAAAADASVALMARVADDEFGEALLDHARSLSIDIGLIRRVRGYNGVYFISRDPGGTSEFVYARRGSAGAGLSRADVEAARLGRSKAVVISGITQALSAACAQAVETAARRVNEAGGMVIYDPNFRSRLTTPRQARLRFERIAQLTSLVTPSCPNDTLALLGTADPEAAVHACLAAGAEAAAVTCGADGVLFANRDRELRMPAIPAPVVADATGAGDVFTGTVAARLALGDEIETALSLGVSAASLSLANVGGTTAIAPLEKVRRHVGLATDPAQVDA